MLIQVIFSKNLTEVFENRNRLLIFVTDDLPSITSTMISTPIARKSQMSEHVERLTQENKKQKQEVCKSIFILIFYFLALQAFLYMLHFARVYYKSKSM